MSTQLDLEKYCDGCDGLTPVVVKLFAFNDNESYTTIRCEHEKKCRRMYEHIKKEVMKNAVDSSGL